MSAGRSHLVRRFLDVSVSATLSVVQRTAEFVHRLLVDAGEQGGELIAITPNNIAYLKRQLEAPAAPPTVRRRAASSRASEA